MSAGTIAHRVGRCGLGGVKGHIKAFRKSNRVGKIDAGGNSGSG